MSWGTREDGLWLAKLGNPDVAAEVEQEEVDKMVYGRMSGEFGLSGSGCSGV
jgi:hypothetical protein